MTKRGEEEEEEEEEEQEQDFNVFAGAETGILKGVNVNRKMCISKNFHNLKSLDKVREAGHVFCRQRF